LLPVCAYGVTGLLPVDRHANRGALSDCSTIVAVHGIIPSLESQRYMEDGRIMERKNQREDSCGFRLVRIVQIVTPDIDCASEPDHMPGGEEGLAHRIGTTIAPLPPNSDGTVRLDEQDGRRRSIRNNAAF